MGNFIGIDLGTTFSAVAMIDEVGRPSIVYNDEGDNLTPSCVYIDHEYNSVIVGKEAYRVWKASNGKEAATRFKRDMGTGRLYSVKGKEFTPITLSSLLLKKLYKDVTAKLGSIDEIIVTIPANFSNAAREATMRAAKEAGLNVEYIINEPTAAALFYAYQNGGSLNGTFAIYDLGGGTFDVSLIKVSGTSVEVLNSNGVSRLGGDDFDLCLYQIIQKKYKDQTGEDFEDGDYTLGDAEDDKKSLSKRKKIIIHIARKIIEVTREEFEEAISSRVTQAEMLCETTLDEAGVKVDDIDQVLLAGGSTRIPYVRESIKRAFNQEPISPANVDEVVALGAALYAVFKGDESKLNEAQKRTINKLELNEITGKCFGTTALCFEENRRKEELQNVTLIKKNTNIPCSVTKTFYTIGDGQTRVRCDVTESISIEKDPKFITTIWEGELDLPPGRPAGQKIEVSFSYDINQTMKCSYLDISSGIKAEVNLEIASTVSQDDIDINEFVVE